MGADDRTVFRTVILPLVRPYLISGYAFAFVLSLNEYIVAYMVAGFTVETLPIKIFNSLRYGYTPVMASVAVVFVLVAILVFGLIARFGDLPKLLGAWSSKETWSHAACRLPGARRQRRRAGQPRDDPLGRGARRGRGGRAGRLSGAVYDRLQPRSPHARAGRALSGRSLDTIGAAAAAAGLAILTGFCERDLGERLFNRAVLLGHDGSGCRRYTASAPPVRRHGGRTLHARQCVRNRRAGSPAHRHPDLL